MIRLPTPGESLQLMNFRTVSIAIRYTGSGLNHAHLCSAVSNARDKCCKRMWSTFFSVSLSLVFKTYPKLSQLFMRRLPGNEIKKKTLLILTKHVTDVLENALFFGFSITFGNLYPSILHPIPMAIFVQPSLGDWCVTDFWVGKNHMSAPDAHRLRNVWDEKAVRESVFFLRRNREFE